MLKHLTLEAASRLELYMFCTDYCYVWYRLRGHL